MIKFVSHARQITRPRQCQQTTGIMNPAVTLWPLCAKL